MRRLATNSLVEATRLKDRLEQILDHPRLSDAAVHSEIYNAVEHAERLCEQLAQEETGR